MWNSLTGKDELLEEIHRLEVKNSQAENRAHRLERDLKAEEKEAELQKQVRQQTERELSQERKKREEETKALEAKHQAEKRELEENYKEQNEKIKQELYQTHQEELQETEKRLKNIEAGKEALLYKRKEAEERKLSKPWNEFETEGGWTKEYHDNLVSRINEQELSSRVKNVRLLVVGQIHAGKSSFINAVATVDNGRVATPCQCGEATKSLTKKLKRYECEKYLDKLTLLDTMGVEEQENEGFNFHDLIYLIDGNVKPNYQFNPRCPIDKTHSSFKANPTLADKAHCVVIVMDSTCIHSDSITQATRQKIKILEDHIREHEVPVVIVLNKIDQICEEVKGDITNIYLSRAVMSVVEKAAVLFGVPKMQVFPVRCYADDNKYDVKKNILVLLAIKKMKELASDSLKNEESSEHDASDDNTE